LQAFDFIVVAHAIIRAIDFVSSNDKYSHTINIISTIIYTKYLFGDGKWH